MAPSLWAGAAEQGALAAAGEAATSMDWAPAAGGPAVKVAGGGLLTPFGFAAPLGACGPNKTLLEALQVRLGL